MQSLYAFFDESGSHSGSPLLCVAGYIFSKRNARLMSEEWKANLRRFGLSFFHMVDCAHGNKGFSDLNLEKRIAIQTKMIEIIKKRATHGFAVSVDIQAYNELMPSWGPTKTPYAFCARCIIDEVGRWFFKTGFKGRSTYFFEAGHQSRSEADHVVHSVLTNPLMKFPRYPFRLCCPLVCNEKGLCASTGS